MHNTKDIMLSSQSVLVYSGKQSLLTALAILLSLIYGIKTIFTGNKLTALIILLSVGL